MKSFKVLLCALAVLGIQSARAADWKGHTPEEVANATGNDAVVYLYNVGTGLFIEAGATWATEAVVGDVGLPLTLKASGDYWELITTLDSKGTTSEGLIALITNENQHNYGKIFTDRGETDGISDHNFTLTEVPTGSNVYSLQLHGYYLSAVGQHQPLLIQTTDNSSSDTNAQWKLVTLTDRKDYFHSDAILDATITQPADGTFMLYDPNFNRDDNNVSHWTLIGEGSYSWQKAKEVGNYASLDYLPTQFMGENPYPYVIVGNGYGNWGSVAHEADSDYDPQQYTQPQEQFGSYWTANMFFEGKLYQIFTVEASGWYIISCYGFTTTKDAAYLYASVTNAQGEAITATDLLTCLEGDNVPKTFVKAGQLLQQDDYKASVMVYANKGEIIEFGAQQTDGNTTWTSVDNFKIAYTGNDTKYLVLSEQETSMDYINAQVDANQNYVMVLERSLTTEKWNSLMLPVNMTAQQVKLAFGSEVKLSKIVGIDTQTNKYRINFEQVDLRNDKSKGIVAGTLYIVKPTKAPSEAAGAEFAVRGMTDHSIKTTKPYYLVNQIALTAAPAQTNGMVEQENVPGNSITGDLTFKGTYIYQKSESTVPVHSFLLSAKSGKWYFTQSKSYAVKGFRTWIETSMDNQPAKSVAFYNDGELVNEAELTGGATAIDVIAPDAARATGDVYGVNGQLVRKGASSLQGLPKGVYIVNNKKCIVK